MGHEQKGVRINAPRSGRAALLTGGPTQDGCSRVHVSQASRALTNHLLVRPTRLLAELAVFFAIILNLVIIFLHT
jgi:hypothetical protein